MESRLQHARSVLDRFPLERFYKVRGARLVSIDEDALLRDIFETEENEVSAALSRQLCDWLAQEAAVVSAPHRYASEVHSALAISEEDQLFGARLPRQGRACSRILEVPRELSCTRAGSQPRYLWLDSKGTGLRPDRTPTCREYATGLLPLDEALEEWLWSLILDRVMAHAGTPHRCLPIYGIIDLGFWFRDPAGNDRRASILMRRGHFRGPHSDLPLAFTREHFSCLVVELLIRNYGVTSAAEHAPKIVVDGPEISIISEKRQEVVAKFEAGGVDVDISRISGAEIDQINMQFGWSGLSAEMELVDTTHYNTADAFTRPLVSAVADRSGAWGGVILPDSADFVQPDETISLNEEECGWSVEADGVRTKRTKLACSHIAQLIVEGKLQAAETRSILDAFARRATEKLAA